MQDDALFAKKDNIVRMHGTIQETLGKLQSKTSSIMQVRLS
jgi:hypothetical protein